LSVIHPWTFLIKINFEKISFSPFGFFIITFVKRGCYWKTTKILSKVEKQFAFCFDTHLLKKCLITIFSFCSIRLLCKSIKFLAKVGLIHSKKSFFFQGTKVKFRFCPCFASFYGAWNQYGYYWTWNGSLIWAIISSD
jgi:hypothetical protein